jgi:hypothetical protein
MRGVEEPLELPEFCPPRQDEIVLWGTIATVHYRAAIPGDPEGDATLYNVYLEMDRAARVYHEAALRVQRTIGPGFDIRINAPSGSLELGVEIVASGYASYKAIGEYPHFREDLLRLISDTQRYLQGRLWLSLGQAPYAPVQVTTVDFHVGPSLAAAETYATVAPVVRNLRNFLVYISLITTALLFCVVVLLIVLLL